MGELTALARERAQRYPDCKPHYHDCERDHLRCLLERLASRIESLEDEPTEAQIEARDALLDYIGENGTASEGVQHYLDRYVRAALAAKEN